jgi:hypothetical protein
MNRQICTLIGLFVFVTAATGFAQTRSVTEKGKVTDVTLYRGQAQVVREIKIKGDVGPLELVVTDLPMYIQPASMFGEASDGLEVRAVRYRPRAVGDVPNEQIAAIDKQMIDIQDQLALVEQKKRLLSKRSAYLDSLDKFVAPTANVELSKGVLDAEALEKITLMSFEQREKIATDEVKLRKEDRELRNELNLLQRERAELTRGTQKTVHEAVLFLDKAKAGDATVRLTYLVSNCGWSPAYNFRADSAKSTVGIEYNALIRQMSGEDWTGVKLTLSTATPQLSAAAPGLAPFRVELAQGRPQGQAKSEQALREQVRGIKMQLEQAQMAQTSNVAMRANLDANWQMNMGANDYQLLEMTNGRDRLAVLREESGTVDNGPSLSYALQTPVSLASRSDQQMIRITEQSLPGDFYHTATPVLSSHVYRQADVKNTTDLDLLSGQVSVYVDGGFVGRMEVPTVARGQTFVIGLGADAQLSTSRELVDRSETTQGGNQVVSFDYRLVVENYHDQKVNVRVFDRVPYTDDSKDLRVTLGEMSDKLSEDAIYLRLDRPKGILRWDIEVPANASGAKARMVEFDYKLEYARQFFLSNPAKPGAAAPADEFMELQRNRLKY